MLRIDGDFTTDMETFLSENEFLGDEAELIRALSVNESLSIGGGAAPVIQIVRIA